MWHFNHQSARDIKFAKQLLYSVQAAGKMTFPDFSTMWHFDDKVGQKYLLEAIGAPLVPSWVFYNKMEALNWASKTDYPKVFKLRGGAGSEHVRLVKSGRQAVKLIKKSFGSGFSQYPALKNLKERWRKYRLGKTSFFDVLKGMVRLVYTTKYARLAGKEKGYCYFQDFIPGNSFDIRVVVIGSKAFAIKRMVRKNDFRASGSGEIYYEKEHFDTNTIRLAFETSSKIKARCLAYDFVYLQDNPLIVEISYGFSPAGYMDCPGYWDDSLNWHEGKFDPYGWMVEFSFRNVNSKDSHY
jgi:glutathione synthase/RimK-type ligase-like ATP-grasp enzyme